VTLALEPQPAFVRIGSRVAPFTSYAQVSSAYRAAIEKTGATGSGETGPRAPDCDILDAHYRMIGWISYNGRAWRGNDRYAHTKQDEIIFDRAFSECWAQFA
jgi:hypothetical protein